MPRTHLLSVTKKDLTVQTFRAGGPGGQNQNKVETGVRIIHSESGAVAESREQRTQLANKKIALRRLAEHPKFRLWLNRRAWEIKHQKTIDQVVDELMDDRNLKFEGQDENGKWVAI